MVRYQTVRRGAVLVVCGLAAAPACGEEDAGQGTLAVEIWGEDFIEHGIPATEFADGWSVVFDKFLVAVDGLSVARGSGAPDIEDGTQRVFDLTRPGPFPFLTRQVPAGRYDRTSYRVGPAVAGAVAGNATTDDVALMVGGGYAVYLAGTATDGTVTKTFRWGFDSDTRYTGCQSQANLASGGAGTVQITIHADHLFYDDLFSETPDVRFAEIARADADGDGEVTAVELAAHDITGLADYGTGSLAIDNLWDFIEHLTGTLGHIDGEGHCHTEASGH